RRRRRRLAGREGHADGQEQARSRGAKKSALVHPDSCGDEIADRTPPPRRRKLAPYPPPYVGGWRQEAITIVCRARNCDRKESASIQCPDGSGDLAGASRPPLRPGNPEHAERR